MLQSKCFFYSTFFKIIMSSIKLSGPGPTDRWIHLTSLNPCCYPIWWFIWEVSIVLLVNTSMHLVQCYRLFNYNLPNELSDILNGWQQGCKYVGWISLSDASCSCLKPVLISITLFWWYYIILNTIHPWQIWHHGWTTINTLQKHVIHVQLRPMPPSPPL